MFLMIGLPLYYIRYYNPGQGDLFEYGTAHLQMFSNLLVVSIFFVVLFVFFISYFTLRLYYGNIRINRASHSIRRFFRIRKGTLIFNMGMGVSLCAFILGGFYYSSMNDQPGFNVDISIKIENTTEELLFEMSQNLSASDFPELGQAGFDYINREMLEMYEAKEDDALSHINYRLEYTVDVTYHRSIRFRGTTKSYNNLNYETTLRSPIWDSGYQEYLYLWDIEIPVVCYESRIYPSAREIHFENIYVVWSNLIYTEDDGTSIAVDHYHSQALLLSPDGRIRGLMVSSDEHNLNSMNYEI